MGGLYSMHSAWQNEESTESIATPTYPMKHKRLLSLDPRSPGMDRTPILVDRTPVTTGNGLALCDSVSTTPLAAPALLKDPRSPTNEFLRTPIPFALPAAVQQQEARRVAEANQDLEDSLSPSQQLGSESGIDSTEVTPVLRHRRVNNMPADSPDVLESPDSAVSEGYTESHEHMSDISDGSPDVVSPEPDVSNFSPLVVEAKDDSLSEATSNSVKPMNANIYPTTSVRPVPTNIEVTPKLSIASKGPSKVGKKPGQLSWSPVVTRSPLSLVENSHRALVDRQDKPTVTGKSGQLVSARIIDKENIYH